MNLAIIQARVGSSRLPGKVLKDLHGEPMLGQVIRRVRGFKKVTKAVIATSTNPRDQAVADIANAYGIDFYRGSEEDVLARFYEAAKTFKAQTVIRITADCPLIDPVLGDKIIVKFEAGGMDYISNTLRPTFPDGLDVEVFSFTALETAFHQAKRPSEREHVTPYIWGHPAIYRIDQYLNDQDLSALRWTVDTQPDFDFVQEIYKNLYRAEKIFLMEDILRLLAAKPDIAKMNAGQTRQEGYARSLAEESRLWASRQAKEI